MTPNASASISGDLEITKSISPKPGDYMTSWDSIFITVEITNVGFFYNTEYRQIEWFICEGIQDESDCYNSREDRGTGQIQPVQVGQTVNYTFPQTFSPGGDEGRFTFVYRFINSDGNTTNDVNLFTIDFTRSLVDIEIGEQDPTEQLTGLSEYNGEYILNTDTDYNMTISGFSTSCSSCGLVGGLGWILTDSQGNEVATSISNYTNLPSWGGRSSFTRDLPSLNYTQEGRYNMTFGLISSSGTPDGDMNSYNNLQSVEIIFDDSVDLEITSMNQVFKQNETDQNYYYGNDSLSVIVTNNGNITLAEPVIRFTLMDINEVTEYIEDCVPDEIEPGQSFNCIFDINKEGDKKFRVFAEETLFEGIDEKPSDNSLSQNVLIVRGDINPLISQSEQSGIYKTADNITFIARTSGTAAAPLTYSWWLYGIDPRGEGPSIEVRGEDIGLGDHYMTLRVTDALGYTEVSNSFFTIFNSTMVKESDWLNGTSVTRTHAKSVVELDYPIAGLNYRAGTGMDPLLRLSVDVVPTTEDLDAGMDWMDFDLNLSKILPDNIPRESISVYQLQDFDSTTWSELDGNSYFQLVDEDTMNVYLKQNMDLLIVGELPTPEVDAGNVSLTKMPDGKMMVDWEPSGDLENPYFGGWNVYRITSPITASAFFPDPDVITSEFVWEGLMANSLSITLEGTSNSWYDERPLETGICSSYAIIPTDRAGVPKYTEAKVSTVDGTPGLMCGDAIDPLSEVSNFNHNVVYTNNTDCYELFIDWSRCYVLTLSWTWPDHELDGNISWNMYRIEYRPDDVDLRYIEPIATGLKNIPGEKVTFVQNGTDYDGIKPYRTYYYILAPLDYVGNELTLIDYPSPNVERVYVEDQYWEYNQERIPIPPPPPEPPYGVDWLGTLQDDIKQDNFQLAGIIMLFTIMINFIVLPLILRKRKRLKKVIAKRKGKKNIDDNEFDEFFN